MAILKIVTLPAKTLHEPSAKVDRVFMQRPETKKFIEDLIETMYDDDGIGIASPQVGQNIHLCIIGKNAVPGKKKDLVLANLLVERTSKKTTSDIEGCLSVPNTYGTVKRAKDVHVTALDENGDIIEFDAKNFFARVIQHEVDHLNGMLFIDRATDTYTIRPEDPNYKTGQGVRNKTRRLKD